MIVEKYIPGKEKNAAYSAIYDMMKNFDPGQIYADVMRHRISGAAATECNDTYYVAHEDSKALSRLWMGWGKHADAIGNWGNFYTAPEHRGRGIGGELLSFWFEDLKKINNAPLCFLCTASSEALVSTYAKFGFRPAIEGKKFGPLYMPLGKSPESFREFYTEYYKPSKRIYLRRATLNYRHEIDCLLRFSYINQGLKFGFEDMPLAELALMRDRERCGMLFAEDGHCVGWSYNGEIQVYQLYNDSDIIREEI